MNINDYLKSRKINIKLNIVKFVGIVLEIFIWGWNIATTVFIQIEQPLEHSLTLMFILGMILVAGIIGIQQQFYYIWKFLQDVEDKGKIKMRIVYKNLTIINGYLIFQMIRGILVYHRVQFVTAADTYQSGFNAFFDQNCMILGPQAICTTQAKYLEDPHFIEECANDYKKFYKHLQEPIVSQAICIFLFTAACMFFLLQWDTIFNFSQPKIGVVAVIIMVFVVMVWYFAKKIPIEIKKPEDAKKLK